MSLFPPGLHLGLPYLPMAGASTTFAEALLASAWSGCLLAAAASLALRALPGLSAAARSWLWVSVLVVALTLPVLPALVHVWHPAQAHGVGLAGGHAGLVLSQRWSLLLVAISAVLSGWRVAMLAASALRLRKVARRARPVSAGNSVQRILADAGRSAELCVSADVQRPSVAGFLRPRILLPAGLFEAITTVELEQIVLHELAHLERRDDWTNLLQKAALAMFPLNPVLVWLDRRLCLERELACDDAVLGRTGARKAYAACLVALAERNTVLGRGLSLALGAWDRESELLRRVRRILTQPGRAMGLLQMRVATTMVAVGVASGAVVLAHAPRLVTFAAPVAMAKAEPAIAVAELADLPLPGGSHDAEPAKTAAPVRGCRKPAGRQAAAKAGDRLTVLDAELSTGAGSPREVLTAAHVAVHPNAMARPSSQTFKMRHMVPARANARTVALTQGEWMSLFTVWSASERGSLQRNAAERQPMVHVRSSQPALAGRMEYQPTFAAVPTPDGWLIVQL